jgi:hypothetical protein
MDIEGEPILRQFFRFAKGFVLLLPTTEQLVWTLESRRACLLDRLDTMNMIAVVLQVAL